MPILASQAWKEAAASVSKEPMLLALEFQNPAFVENSVATPVRVVANTADMTFRIESSAEVNPGDDVVFKGVPFECEAPRIGENGGAEWTIRVDNIGREISKYMEDAIQLSSEITVIVRGYLPSRPTEVGYGPYTGYGHSVRIKGATTEMAVTIADPQNRKFGRETYDMARFPSLLAIQL